MYWCPTEEPVRYKVHGECFLVAGTPSCNQNQAHAPIFVENDEAQAPGNVDLHIATVPVDLGVEEQSNNEFWVTGECNQISLTSLPNRCYVRDLTQSQLPAYRIKPPGTSGPQTCRFPGAAACQWASVVSFTKSTST